MCRRIDSPDSSTPAAPSTRRQTSSDGASDVTPPLQDNMAVGDRPVGWPDGRACGCARRRVVADARLSLLPVVAAKAPLPSLDHLNTRFLRPRRPRPSREWRLGQPLVQGAPRGSRDTALTSPPSSLRGRVAAVVVGRSPSCAARPFSPDHYATRAHEETCSLRDAMMRCDCDATRRGAARRGASWVGGTLAALFHALARPGDGT